MFRGVHVERLNRDQRSLLRRRYLGFVFQGFNLLARTTAQLSAGVSYGFECSASRISMSNS